MILDESASYDAVYGIPGVSFTQNGRYFNIRGTEVAIERHGEGDDERIHCVLVDEAAPMEALAEKSGLEGMHWKQLKVLMETYGLPWVDRADAIKHLTGVVE